MNEIIVRVAEMAYRIPTRFSLVKRERNVELTYEGRAP